LDVLLINTSKPQALSGLISATDAVRPLGNITVVGLMLTMCL
jgi:hypothetical protein